MDGPALTVIQIAKVTFSPSLTQNVELTLNDADINRKPSHNEPRNYIIDIRIMHLQDDYNYLKWLGN